MTKILIADDSVFMRTVLKDIVLQSNFKDVQIIEAADGEEAISKFNSDKPDLVLLDVVMPKKNGIDVLKQIGALAPAVVIVSSVGQEEIIEEAKSLGAKHYIVKPFEPKQVIEILNSLLTTSE